MNLAPQIKLNQTTVLHRIAFILAIQFAVLSTQPIWQPLKQAVFGSCGGSVCSASTTLPSCPSGNEDAPSKDGCCAPFTCCFPCCCFCQQTAQFPDFAEGEKNIRPGEDTKTLHSASIGGHFQPPELA